MSDKAKDISKLIDLPRNIRICLNLGYGTLIRAKSETDYRNAVLNIHNGIELLMKYYLQQKNKLVIYDQITYMHLIADRVDLIKPINKLELNTIKWFKCIEILEHFSKLPKENETYLAFLNKERNKRVHFEYYSNNDKLKKNLIANIYPFIKEFISELNLKVEDFIKEDHIITLDKLKKHIDDKMVNDLIEKIERAKKHYFEDLTDEERKQKHTTQDYKLGKRDKLISCPSCSQIGLLAKKIHFEEIEDSSIIKRRILLSEFSCHYCGLNIIEYDQLRHQFREEEEVLSDIIMHDGKYNVVPDSWPDFVDCPAYDCDCDCPDDCPNYDCDCDCPDDCPAYDCDCDCPDDCPNCDCDCDCPNDCPW